ncbi:MAG TPA: DNA-binding protein [Gammaproteobacteria bacterium]|nr:DNA-binding protein [Gammaproteobacteria bacterium]
MATSYANPTASSSPYMSVREVAKYLHLNEKKIYLLASEGKIPATKITGKWLFPRELVDQWILNASHGGVLTDRMIIGGCDDPLITRTLEHLNSELNGQALFSYCYASTPLGLRLLQRNKIDACCMRWGPAPESAIRHPAFLRRFNDRQDWILVRAFTRAQGLIVRKEISNAEQPLDALVRAGHRWALRSEGSGAQRIFAEQLGRAGLRMSDISSAAIAASDHEAAALVARGQIDIVPGAHSSAREFGLGFVSLCHENIDLVLPRNIYFRKLLHKFLEYLTRTPDDPAHSRGYDFATSGRIVWSHEANT